MTVSMRIALAQINTTVGDLDGNAEKILEFANLAETGGADLVVFPELTITGYPPRDFVEKQSFVDRTADALQKIAQHSRELNVAIVAGYVARTKEPSAISAQNAAAIIHRGQIVFEQRKMLLPNYDVFDEARYFEPAQSQSVYSVPRHQDRTGHLRRRLERQAVSGRAIAIAAIRLKS